MHQFYIYLQDNMQAHLAEVGQNRNFAVNTENAAEYLVKGLRFLSESIKWLNIFFERSLDKSIT